VPGFDCFLSRLTDSSRGRQGRCGAPNPALTIARRGSPMDTNKTARELAEACRLRAIRTASPFSREDLLSIANSTIAMPTFWSGR
jgi:hypothetical protein